MHFDLIIFFHFVFSDKQSNSDFEIVIFSIKSRETLTVTCCGRHELLLVDEEHFAGVVADNVVAPASQFELLSIVGEGKASHSRADDGAETRVGNDVDPGHRGVGVGDDIVQSVAVEAAVLVVEIEVAPNAEFLFRFKDFLRQNTYIISC